MSKHLFVSLVWLAGGEPQTGQCVKAAIREAEAKGWKVTLSRTTGHSLIANARNWELAQFRRSGADVMVCVDHDVVGEDGALMKLAEYPVDVAAGIYPTRFDPIEFRVEYLPNVELREDPIVRNGLLEIGSAAAGFLKISRECVERMCTEYADREYDHQLGQVAWCLFDCGLDGRVYRGEDTMFCKRWRAIGGRVWCNPEFMMGHIGLVDTMRPELGKKVYAGRFADHLRKQAGIDQVAA
jgi:hypothetical protein